MRNVKMDIRYFKKKIKDVKVSDILSVFPMATAFLLRPLFRRKYRDIWLICEEKREARDNGYHFFKYLCEHQPQLDCVYAIDKRCKDHIKVASLGKTVHHGSLKHWILYFTAKYNISSQKGGKPNAAMCAFLELNGLFQPQNIFLQHGVTISKLDWLMADRCRFDFFVAATTSEQAFVETAFGYDPDIVHLTGFPRFDNLHDWKAKKNRIILVPTWRKWLRLHSESTNREEMDFRGSEFLRKWLELLTSSKLTALIRKYELDVVFCLHRQMQEYTDMFREASECITILSSNDCGIQELMKSAQMMITDYSSVCFDMFYMKKPVIFYQFDEEEYRKRHYEQGWFDYHHNPFANSYPDCFSVLEELERYILTDYRVPELFVEGHTKEFRYFDRRNSERVYEALKGLK